MLTRILTTVNGLFRTGTRTRSQRGIPRKQQQRACLQVESLEGRDLMSGLTLAASSCLTTHAGGANHEALTGAMNYASTPTLSAVAVSGTEIDLSWSNVSGSNGSVIDEWLNGGWRPIATAGSGATSYAISGLNPGTTYYFWLGDATSAGTAWDTTYRDATTFRNNLAAPEATASAASMTEIDLSWNNVSGATGYVVDQWISGAWQRIGTVSGTSDVITGLSSGTTYYFWVGAGNANGTVWAPSYVYATTLQDTLTAPALTVTAVSMSEIDLSWNSVSGATGYVIDQWVSGAWRQIGTVSGTSDAVTGLNAGTTYYFWIGSYDATTTKWAPTYELATTLQDPLTAPTFTASAASATEIDLAWNSVTGATGYLVDEWTSTGWTPIANVNAGATSEAVTGLNPQSTYFFWVGAYDANRTMWASTFQFATTVAQTSLAAPSFTAGAVSGTEIDLAWNTVSGAQGYLVQESVNGVWTQLATLASNATHEAVTGLNPHTTYDFRVGAFNATSTSWAADQSATTLSSSTITIDHPAAGGAYSAVSGSLFGANGPVYTDVEQGAEGDCWLLASLAEVAAREPSVITSMFSADGTAVENGVTVSLYNVRLYDADGMAREITVDTELPNGGGLYDHPANGVLWVALAEKAYAQANGAGIVTSGNAGSDSYDALNEGVATWALQAITGLSANQFDFNPDDIAAAWNAGELIVLGSSSTASSPYIVGDSSGTHAYAVVGYDPSSAQPFEVYNPWGTDANGWALGMYNNHQVYGLFTADANFLEQNFATENLGVADQVALDAIWAEVGDPDSAGNLLVRARIRC